MTWEELLKSVGKGEMPKVKIKTTLKFATSNEGVVTTIKDNGKHRGVGVTFPGCKWEDWFHESPSTDQRSKYLRDLELV